MIYHWLCTFIYIIGVSFQPHQNDNKVSLDELFVHPFHLSKCHIKYKDQDSTLELSLVLFVDDFEEALKTISTKKSLHLCDELLEDSTLYLIDKYLMGHLSVYNNNQLLSTQYIGSECSNNGLTIWSYIEYKLKSKPNSIRVNNDIFIELFADQKNIVDVELSKGHLVERLMTNQLTEAIFED